MKEKIFFRFFRRDESSSSSSKMSRLLCFEKVFNNSNTTTNSNKKKSGQFVLNQKRMRRKLVKENVFHINNRKACFRKPLNYLRQNHIYCRNNELKRYEFINTTDMDSMISSVSFNDYQFALDCMNTSESSESGSSRSSPAPQQQQQQQSNHLYHHLGSNTAIVNNATFSHSSIPICDHHHHRDSKRSSKNYHNVAKLALKEAKKNLGGLY